MVRARESAGFSVLRYENWLALRLAARTVYAKLSLGEKTMIFTL
jgi:hypothetical protein